MRRILALIVFGGVLLVLWRGLESERPPQTEPFLGVLEQGGRLLVVRSLDTHPGGAPHWAIEGPEDEAATVRTGSPRAVVGAGEREVVAFFDDGAARIGGVGTEDESWTRISYGESAFLPSAALRLEDGRTLVVGRREAQSAELAVAWLEGDGIRFEEKPLAVPPSAADVQIVEETAGASLVWRQSSGRGVEVRGIALTAAPDDEPVVKTERPEILALASASTPTGALLLLLGDEGALTVLGPGDAERTIRLRGLAGDVPRRMVAHGGKPPRLYALAAGRVLSWTIDETSGADAVEPDVLEAPPDVRWLLLGMSAMAAALLTILGVALGSRKRPPETPPRLAGLGSRLAAWVLDSLLVAPLSLLAGSTILGVDPGRFLGAALMSGPFDGEAQTLVLFFDAGLLAYFVAGEALFGRTLGKKALGLRTVNLDGGAPSVGAVILRNVLRILIDQNGGAVLALLTPRRQRIGDWLAKTMVIESPRGRAGAEDDRSPDGDEGRESMDPAPPG